jgi:hypothetical protein
MSDSGSDAPREEWRIVPHKPGRPGGYSVSSCGRVRSPRGRILRIRHRKHDGYAVVSLVQDRRHSVPTKVAHLVAEAFLGPRPSIAHVVRHLDGSRDNDTPSNLSWGTQQENCDDRERHGMTARGERNPRHGKPGIGAKLDSSVIATIRMLSGLGYSQRIIAAQAGVHQATVWRVLSGKAYANV